MKYADDVVLLAKEETVLQGTTDRLTESGRCYGMECGKCRVMRISRQPSPVHMIDQKQLENGKYFNYLDIMVKRDKHICMKLKYRTSIAKAAFNNKKPLLTSKKDLNLRKKLVNCCIWSIALYYAKTWKLWKVDQKYLEKISWTDCVRNGVLQRVKKERNILQTVRRRKANWIGHILHRNCLLKHVIEGKMEERLDVMGTQGRRHKQLLDDLNEKKGYWKLKELELDHT